jgi:predicted metal-binding membrane protein
MGSRHAVWCLGCCSALMAGLFALGVMSLSWMAFIAALIALEKTAPWKRPITWGVSAILLVLAIALVATPNWIPGLVVPGGSHHAMGSMSTMR